MRALQGAKDQAYGLCFLVALGGIIVLTGAMYAQVFEPVVPVTLKADRSGLLMKPGADVKLRGVVVGEVSNVSAENKKAVLSLELEPDMTDRIPADVGARLAPTTVFGAKFVDLVVPRDPAAEHIQAGAVIGASRVAVEINDVLEDLLSLLRTVEPAKLNATLGAVASSLEGRGDDLGRYLVELDRYLRRFNPSLPTLQRDLATLPDVLHTYADVSPELLRSLDNLTFISNTVINQRAALAAFLLDFTVLGDTGREMLARNEDSIIRALAVAAPVTALIARYSPMFPCFFKGMDRLRNVFEKAIGGKKPGLNAINLPVYGQEPYKYPEDLPEVAVDTGPDCYGLPDLSERENPVPYIDFDDGTSPFPTGNESPQFSDQWLPRLLARPMAPGARGDRG